MEQHAIDQEIEACLEKQIIEQCQHEPEEIIFPIFLRPKKEPAAYRVIFNLKFLNQNISYHTFKMDILESAIKLIKPGCCMTSINLRDAYYSILISPAHRKYLKFAWKGLLFQFRTFNK